MQSGDKKLLGAGLIVLALIILQRKQALAVQGLDPNGFYLGWGRYEPYPQSGGTGGLITAGIGYTDNY